MNVRFSLPTGYAPLAGVDRTSGTNERAHTQSLRPWVASLSEMAKYNDPSLFRELLRFIEECKTRKVALVQELTARDAGGQCLLEYILESKDYRAMKLVFAEVPLGWLVPEKVEKTTWLLLLWDSEVPGKARGLQWIGGTVYVGEFFNKQQCGQGRLYVGPMAYFEGQFENNQRVGKFLCYDEAKRPQKRYAMYIDDNYCGNLPGPLTDPATNSFSSLLAGLFQYRK